MWVISAPRTSCLEWVEYTSAVGIVVTLVYVHYCTGNEVDQKSKTHTTCTNHNTSVVNLIRKNLLHHDKIYPTKIQEILQILYAFFSSSA